MVRLYTEEIAEEILERLTDGEGLLKICREVGISDGAVRKWVMNDHKGFASRYAMARQLGFQRMADEIVEIADDSADDYITVDGERRVNHDAINRSRLKVDTRKWMLAKVLPKIYGDKVAIDVDGAVEVKAVTNDKLESRIADLIGKAGTAGFIGRTIEADESKED